jgi:hypothetical protein
MNELPDGWLSAAEADELRRLAAGKVVLELGAWKGRSTCAMAETAELVVSVDRHKPFEHFGEWTWEDSLPDYLAAVRGLENVVAVIGEFSVAKMFGEQLFGLVFVDGLHDFANVTADLEIARCFNCPIALHDYGRWDVQPACDALGMTPNFVVERLAVFA